jgi:WD40 repeat protein
MQETLDGLASDPRTLHLATSLVLSGRPPSTRLMLVVDQFEEVFTLCRDNGSRAAFFANLVYAATIPGGSTVVLPAMRADFYHHCSAYPELAQQLAANGYLVSPLQPDGLRQAVEEPARRVGLSFEPGLVTTILEDVAEQPGALPLLEHALLELWERRAGGVLTLAGYRESGGVQGAIAARAEEVFGSLESDQQQLARNSFLRLTQPGEGTEDTRRRARLSELESDGRGHDVTAVVRRLVDARLLTTSRDDTGAEVVEVAHEALIRGWPRLRAWLDDDRAGLLVHRRITEASDEWLRLDRDEDVLYRGARLAEAVEWRRRGEEVLNEPEREFLAASQAAELNELEQERRRTRTFRALSAALAGLLIAAVAAGTFALIQTRHARHEAVNARAGELAARALNLLSVDPVQGLRLADRAVHDRSTTETRAALREALAVAPILQLHLGTGPARPSAPSVAFSPDGSLIVDTGSKSPEVWDVAAGRRVSILIGHRHETIFDPTFSPDSRLVVTQDDVEFRVWQARTGRSVAALRMKGQPIEAAFSPRGDLLATEDTHDAAIWSTATWKRIRVFPNEYFGYQGAVHPFSPDGGRLALEPHDNSAFVFRDTRRWRRLASIGLSGQVVHQLAYSPDGRTVAVTSNPAGNASPPKTTTLIVRSITGRQVVTPIELRGAWLNPAFAPNGRKFALFDQSTGVFAGGPLGGTEEAEVTFWDTGTWKKDGTRKVDGLSQDWTVGFRRGDEGVVELVDIATNRQFAILRTVDFSSNGAQVVFSPGANGLVAIDDDGGSVRVWNMQAAQAWVSPSEFPAASPIDGLAIGPRRGLVAIAHVGGRMDVWRRGAKSVLRVALEGHSGMSFSPDGRFLAAGRRCKYSGGCVEIVSTSTWQHVATLRGGDTATWSADNKFVAVSEPVPYQPQLHGLHVHRTGTWELIFAKGGPHNLLASATFSADGTMIASERWSRSALSAEGILVWNIAHANIVARLESSSGDSGSAPPAASFLPTGDELVSPNVITLVSNGRTGARIATLHLQGAVRDLAFSADGRFAAMMLEIRNVSLETFVWRTDDWKLAASFPGSFADFSRDGRLLLTTSDQEVRAWEVETGEQVLDLTRSELLGSPVFADGDRSIVAVGNGQAVRSLACPGCAPVNELLALADRRISAYELP